MLVAIDIGTRAGWALCTTAGYKASGVWHFKPRHHENWAKRFSDFRFELGALHAIEKISLLRYEEVRRHKGTTAGHIYGGFLVTLQDFCNQRDIPFEGVGVGTIKKYATGKGNAGKAAMIEAVEDRWGVVAFTDDEADAVALREYALEHDKRTKEIDNGNR